MTERRINLQKVYDKLQKGQTLTDEESQAVSTLSLCRNARTLKEAFGIDSKPGLPGKILRLLRGRSAQEL